MAIDGNIRQNALDERREALDRIDDTLAKLLRDRWDVVKEIALIKATHGLNTFDPNREMEILNRVTEAVASENQKAAIQAVFSTILEQSKLLQEKDRL